MADSSPNVWKFATLGLLLVLATAGVTALVVSKWSSSDAPAPAVSQTGRQAGAGGASSQGADARAAAQPAGRQVSRSPQQTEAPSQVSTSNQPAPGGAASRAAAGPPSQAVIDECNRYAGTPASDRDKYWEIGKDAVIGGAATAALGAAAGAIAGGGKGAGKGAAIGGIVGVAAGSLYGINENRKNDEEYKKAYAACLRARGYAG
jgi:hypothetical protein